MWTINRISLSKTVSDMTRVRLTYPMNRLFKSIGKLSHISDLPVLTNRQKLDCILLGTYPQHDRTIFCLNEFLTNENNALQWKDEALRQDRTIITYALKMSKDLSRYKGSDQI
jgi:hypothetical protein